MTTYAKRSNRRTVKKRCARCGTVGWYRPRELRCKHQKFGPRSFCCWGELTPVRPPLKPLNLPPWRGIGSVLGEFVATIGAHTHDAVADMTGGHVIKVSARKPQAIAQRRLEETRRKIAKASAEVTKLAKTIARRQKTIQRLEIAARRYAQRASMTDQEVEREREKRLEREKRRAARNRTREIHVED